MLRKAGADDAPAITACVLRAYAKYAVGYRTRRSPSWPTTPRWSARSPTWLLEHEGQCVGVLVLVPRADHLLLENVAVDPAHQGRGLGRLLLDFAEAEARRLGLPAVRLYTNALMTENMGIYSARGYVETERREIDGRRCRLHAQMASARSCRPSRSSRSSHCRMTRWAPAASNSARRSRSRAAVPANRPGLAPEGPGAGLAFGFDLCFGAANFDALHHRAAQVARLPTVGDQ